MVSLCRRAVGAPRGRAQLGQGEGARKAPAPALRVIRRPSRQKGARECRADGEASTASSNVSSRRHALGFGLISSALALALDLSVAGAGPWPGSFARAAEGTGGSANAGPSLRRQTDEERAAIERGLSQVTKGKAPVLLRLVFHDAGTFDEAAKTGGPNGSIRFELGRPESRGLRRGCKVVKDLRERIRSQSGLEVSYADLVVICGAWAVRVCGGPVMEVQLGRRDAEGADPAGMIPDENLPATGIKAAFARMGLTPRDLVALSGSHALGGKGFGDPLTFDNVYYTTLLEKPWTDTKDEMKQMIGIPSDRVLPDDPESRKIVEEFARDENKFFASFAESYTKLTTLGGYSEQA